MSFAKALVWQCSSPRMSPEIRASGGGVGGDCGGGFPAFLPKEVHKIKDPFARNLAQRIQRLPVQVQFCYCMLLYVPPFEL